MDDNSYPSLDLSCSYSITLHFSFSIPISHSYISYSSQFVSIQMSVLDHTLDHMTSWLQLFAFVEVFLSDEFCKKEFDAVNQTLIPFLERLQPRIPVNGGALLKAMERMAAKQDEPS